MCWQGPPGITTRGLGCGSVANGPSAVERSGTSLSLPIPPASALVFGGAVPRTPLSPFWCPLSSSSAPVLNQSLIQLGAGGSPHQCCGRWLEIRRGASACCPPPIILYYVVLWSCVQTCTDGAVPPLPEAMPVYGTAAATRRCGGRGVAGPMSSIGWRGSFGPRGRQPEL